LNLRSFKLKIKNPSDEIEKLTTLFLVAKSLRFYPFIIGMRIIFERNEGKGGNTTG